MSWQVVRDVVCTARFGRDCVLCGEKIVKGETYVSRVVSLGDRLSGFTMHVDCEKLTELEKWSSGDWGKYSHDEFKSRLLNNVSSQAS